MMLSLSRGGGAVSSGGGPRRCPPGFSLCEARAGLRMRIEPTTPSLSPSSRMPTLQILKGPGAGQTIPLDGGDRFILGRNPDCAVIIPNFSVSREHAQILRIGGKFFIEDRQS